MFVRSKLKASVTTYKARSSGAKPTPQERFLVVPCAFQFSRRVSRARYSLAVDVFKFQRGVIPIQEREVRLKRVERHERRESLNSLSPTCLHPCPREGFVPTKPSTTSLPTGEFFLDSWTGILRDSLLQ